MKRFSLAACTLMLLGIGSVHMIPKTPLGVSLDTWRYKAVNWRGDIMESMKTAMQAYESGLGVIVNEITTAPGVDEGPGSANIEQLVEGFKVISTTLEEKFKEISGIIDDESVLSEPTVEQFLRKFGEFVVIFKTGLKEFENTWDASVKELDKIDTLDKQQTKVKVEVTLLGLDIELGREGVKLIETLLNDSSKEWDQELDDSVVAQPHTEIYAKVNQLKDKADQAASAVAGRTQPPLDTAQASAKNMQAYVEEAYDLFKEYRNVLIKRYEEKQVKIKKEYLENIENYMSLIAFQPRSTVVPQDVRKKMTKPTESGAISIRHALSVSTAAAMALATVALYSA